MNRFFVHVLSAILAILCIRTAANCADDVHEQFQSDHEALALDGIWALKRADGSMDLSVRVVNKSAKAIKAFRAKLFKTNDFGENIELLAL